MRPRAFEYYSVSSLDEAVNLLRTVEEPKIIAGGQSLVPLMKFRLASPRVLIDINPILDLNFVREEANVIVVGSLTHHDQIENSSIINSKLQVLSEAASMIADQQVRNRGTIGGALAHADPTGDLPTAACACNATIITISHNGSSAYSASEFFQDYFTTALEPTEIIREIRFPVPPPNTGSAYVKFSRRPGDFAIVSAAAVVGIDDAKICKNARVVLGGVASTPFRATAVEEQIKGRMMDSDLISKAAKKVAESLKPPSDIHASGPYRRRVSTTIVEKALNRAFERVSGRS